MTETGSDSPPVIFEVHTLVRGRARLQVVGLRKRPDLKTSLESVLARHEAVRGVSASTITGNLLLYYDPDRELTELVGVIRTVILAPPEQPVRERGFRGPRPWWERVRDWLRPGAQAPGPKPSALRQLTGLYRVPERPDRPWHMLDAAHAAAFWRVDPASGLSDETTASRLRIYGPNELPSPAPRRAMEMLREQLSSLPVLLLVIAAGLSVATGGVADAVVITAVVALNASIGVITQLKAEKTIRMLLDIPEPDALVLRGGAARPVASAQVVPGDVLLLGRGTHVPADARLLRSADLTADESALTGESMPVEKSAHALGEERLALADRRNMVYKGTVITGGGGIAVVVATGRHTEIGSVQELMGATAQPQTPLQRQMDELGRQMLWVSSAVTGLVFVVGLLRGGSLLEMARSAISLAIAAVPEGLPTVATVSLAKGMRALMAHGIVVRRLEAVEGLGSVQVVCFDKTGTLTHNRMAAVAAVAGMRSYSVSEGEFRDSSSKPVQPGAELLQLLEAAALCNEAEIAHDRGDLALDGSPTELALLWMARDAGVDIRALRERYPRVRTMHRAHQRNYMMTIHGAGPQGYRIAVKGSPTEVLELCGQYAAEGGVHALPNPVRREIRDQNERMARGALRVLGVAYGHLADAGGTPDARGLVWLGLVGIADPPRQGLAELLAAFRRAGMRPVMLTGDQPATARAIAAALHLNGAGKLDAVASSDLEDLSAEEWTEVARRAHIFSRVNPAHKLQIVQALQRDGKVVAMTGDGINDGPALKAADVGIALGRTGTSVARGVADILLGDDDVQALLPAVREGRTVYEDLRKAVHYISATNASEILVMLAALAGGLGQPFNPRQLLWINLITDIFPELALAMDPPPADILDRPPRDPRQPVIGPGDYTRLGRQAALLSGAGMAGYVYGLARYGGGPQASTLAFLALTSAQLLHAFSARSEQLGIASRELPANRYLSAGVAAGFGMLMLSQLLPGLGGLLGTARISLADLLVVIGTASGSLLANEVAKGALRSRALLVALDPSV